MQIARAPGRILQADKSGDCILQTRVWEYEISGGCTVNAGQYNSVIHALKIQRIYRLRALKKRVREREREKERAIESEIKRERGKLAQTRAYATPLAICT